MSRILLTTFGSLGDLHPYIALGVALKSRGHEVVLATSDDYRDGVTSAGLQFAPVPPRIVAPGGRARMARRMFHRRLGVRRLLEEVVFPHLDAACTALAHAAAGADLLVGHPLTFTVPIIAQQRGLPWLSTVLAPASFFSRYDPPRFAVDLLRWAHRMGPRAYGLALSAIRREMWRWEAPLRAFRERMGMPTGQIMTLEGQFSPHGTLALFDPLLAAPQPDWPARTHVCAAALCDDGEVSPEVEDFLAAGDPPIVFALGSAAVWMGQAYFRAAIAAAVRLGRRALLLTGEPWPGRLPPGVKAFPYQPYSRLFPRAALVVHHAGSGTLARALRSGRPQLITPAGFDQLDNAQRASSLGLARVLPFQRVTAGRLQQHLAALLADRQVAEAAQRVSGQLDAQGPLRAAQVIEELLTAPARRSLAGGAESPPSRA